MMAFVPAQFHWNAVWLEFESCDGLAMRDVNALLDAAQTDPHRTATLQYVSAANKLVIYRFNAGAMPQWPSIIAH